MSALGPERSVGVGEGVHMYLCVFVNAYACMCVGHLCVYLCVCIWGYVWGV